MLEEVKRCVTCGCVISNLNDPHTDYLRHIRLKYCDECRQTAERIQTRNRVAEFRRRKKMKDQYRDEQLELLKQENELLRNRVRQLREETNRSNQKGRMHDEIKKADETYRI